MAKKRFNFDNYNTKSFLSTISNSVLTLPNNPIPFNLIIANIAASISFDRNLVIIRSTKRAKYRCVCICSNLVSSSNLVNTVPIEIYLMKNSKKKLGKVKLDNRLSESKKVFDIKLKFGDILSLIRSNKNPQVAIINLQFYLFPI